MNHVRFETAFTINAIIQPTSGLIQNKSKINNPTAYKPVAFTKLINKTTVIIPTIATGIAFNQNLFKTLQINNCKKNHGAIEKL